MCEPAVFTWGAAFTWGGTFDYECLGVSPLGDVSKPYRCGVLEYDAQTARGNLYDFVAEVSCVQYVLFEEFHEWSNATVRSANTSESIPGTFSVPTLSSEEGGGGAYGPGELKNQTLWLNETICFTQAEDELAQQLYANNTLRTYFLGDPSEENCPDYEAMGGSEQPLECCIGEIDVVLDWDKKFAACVAAAYSGVLLGVYLICRCCIQCCVSKCCCTKRCRSTECCGTQQDDSTDARQDDGRAEGQHDGRTKRESRLRMTKKGVTTLFRCGAVSLSLAGYGFNAMDTARYFTTRTIVLGVIYETVVGLLEGFSAFWIGDGFPLNDTRREQTGNMKARRKAGVIVCTLYLAVYLTSVAIDIETRQTCGFSNTLVMLSVGVGMYTVLGVVASLCGKSPGYAQQLFTDILAPWPAIVTTISCEPWIRLGVVFLAMFLGWIGTALVAVYGETISTVTG